MSAIQTIRDRRSSPKLTTPAPTSGQLNSILEAALCAPDHGRLKPWKFLVVKGDARVDLGKLYLEAALAESQDLSEERQQRIKNMPLRAPVVIVVATQPVKGHKVPVLEQMIATGAAVQNMLLAAEEIGVGAMWRTGEMAHKPTIKTGLGLNQTDEIIAYLYLGTAVLEPKQRTPEPLETYCSDWHGSI
ncbi:MAG: nitroreductase [Pseudomonadales bacterium]|nr:nitroreductase [Pseudomonadales bacterium]